MSEMTDANWFALLRASPTPEAGELINVAVVLGNGTIDRLVFEPHLPRLEGVCALREREVYATILGQLAKEVKGATDLFTLRSRIGPQLRISDPRPLMTRDLDVAARALSRRYLMVARTPAEERGERSVRLGRRALDEVVHRSVKLDMRYEHHVTPKNLYEHHADWAMKAKIPSLGRAIRGPKRDMLLDAIRLEPNGVAGALRSAGSRIGLAFYLYRHHREEIAAREGKEVQTTGVLLFPPGRLSPELQEVGGYISEIWEKNADHVLRANHLDVKVKELIGWAVE